MKTETRLGRLFVQFETLEKKQEKIRQEILSIMRKDLKVKTMVLNGLRGTWWQETRPIRNLIKAEEILGLKMYKRVVKKVEKILTWKVQELYRQGKITRQQEKQILKSRVRFRLIKVKFKK